MTQQEVKKLKRSIAIALIIIVFAIAILFIFFSRSFATFQLDPVNAVVTIDNEKITLTPAGVGKKNLTPGVHHVEISASGYVGQNFDYEFKRGFVNGLKFKLTEVPKPVAISPKASLLAKGKDFNDSFYLSSDGKTIYHMKIGTGGDGNIKVIENRPITNSTLAGITEIVWSPNNELALFRKTDGSITMFDFMKYDFLHQTESPWGTNIKGIAWAPDNSKIAYVYEPSNGEKSIIFSNLTNTEMTRMLNLKENNLENPLLRWSPDSRYLLLINQSPNPLSNKIYLFDSFSKELSAITDTGNQIDAEFSPDGNKILYATYSKSPESPVSSVLSVMNSDGSNKQALGIRSELSKSTWKDNNTIMYATYDSSTKKETISGYSIAEQKASGFVIDDLNQALITSMMLSSDGKSLVYQTTDGIFALKVN